MKNLSKTLKKLGIDFSFPIEIKDANGKETYYEGSSGYWHRYEYDVKGRETYFEESKGFWRKRERTNGKQTYYEDSDGTKIGTPRSTKTCEGKVVEVEGIKYKLTAL